MAFNLRADHECEAVDRGEALDDMPRGFLNRPSVACRMSGAHSGAGSAHQQSWAQLAGAGGPSAGCGAKR